MVFVTKKDQDYVLDGGAMIFNPFRLPVKKVEILRSHFYHNFKCKVSEISAHIDQKYSENPQIYIPGIIASKKSETGKIGVDRVHIGYLAACDDSNVKDIYAKNASTINILLAKDNSKVGSITVDHSFFTDLGAYDKSSVGSITAKDAMGAIMFARGNSKVGTMKAEKSITEMGVSNIAEVKNMIATEGSHISKMVIEDGGKVENIKISGNSSVNKFFIGKNATVNALSVENDARITEMRLIGTLKELKGNWFIYTGDLREFLPEYMDSEAKKEIYNIAEASYILQCLGNYIEKRSEIIKSNKNQIIEITEDINGKQAHIKKLEREITVLEN